MQALPSYRSGLGVLLVVGLFVIDFQQISVDDEAMATSKRPKAADEHDGKGDIVIPTAASCYGHGNCRTALDNSYKKRQSLLLSEEDVIYYKKENRVPLSPLVDTKHKFVFFPIPKVACTPWKQLFRRMKGYDDWAGKKDLSLHKRWRNGLVYLYEFDVEEANHIMTSPEYTRAIFVRDPKERLLSAFLDKSRDDGRILRETCCLKREVRVALNLTDIDACVKNALTFEGFVNTLMVACENTHWMPQYQFIDSKFWPYIDFVGHLETAEEDAKTLLQIVGAWEEYGSNGWGKSRNQSIFERDGDRPFHSTHAETKLQHYYTKDLEKKVERFFAGDYNSSMMNLIKF